MTDLALHLDVKSALLDLEKNESPENIIAFIKVISKKKERSLSELVLDYGIKLMADSNEIEKPENFKILEEVFFASLTMRAFDWADFILLLINKHIPRSPKSIRYLAMFKEAIGKDDEAKNLYRELIKANPEDCAAYRRLSAFLSDADLKDEAIQTLN